MRRPRRAESRRTRTRRRASCATTETSALPQRVPGAAMRLDQARRKALIDLRAQVRDIGFDRARPDETFGSPHLIEQLIATEDPVRITQQRDEQIVLARRERDLLAATNRAPRLQLHFEL